MLSGVDHIFRLYISGSRTRAPGAVNFGEIVFGQIRVSGRFDASYTINHKNKGRSKLIILLLNQYWAWWAYEHRYVHRDFVHRDALYISIFTG